MTTLTIIGIALGLAMDAFAVSLACSITLKKVSARQIFRIAFHFGLFQGLMPILGWLAGKGAHEYIVTWDHWIAFGLLLFVGGKAIHEALEEKSEQITRADPTRGISLLLFSVATSIDALAVGLSLAVIEMDIIYPAVIIGVVTAAVSTLGMRYGSRLGGRFGKKMEIAGGVILIGIGIKILLSHLS